MTTDDNQGGAIVPASIPTSLGVFGQIEGFDDAQRKAQVLAKCAMVPPMYQGQDGLANCIVAIDISNRMGMSPFAVMQNMDVIHGRPSWSSKFLIACVNTCGRFTPLRFVLDDPLKPTSCYAEATDKASGEKLVGELITLEMAKAEGWSTKSGSKWRTMPGQMLRYRAAAFWQRTYCPEISIGMATQEEAIDVEPVRVELAAPAAPAPALEAQQGDAAPVATPEPTPPPRRRRKAATPTPEPTPTEKPAVPAEPVMDAEVVEPEPQAAVEAAPAPAPAPAPQPEPQVKLTPSGERGLAHIKAVPSIDALLTAEAYVRHLVDNEGLPGYDFQVLTTALQVRRLDLEAPLTAAERQQLLAQMDGAEGLEQLFGEAFPALRGAPLRSAVTQRQHALFIQSTLSEVSNAG